MTTIKRKEVNSIIEQANNQLSDEDIPEWEYWRDSGNVNCWIADDWLLQVGHSTSSISIENLENGEGAAAAPGNHETATTFISLAVVNPSMALRYLRGQDDSQSYSISVIIDEGKGQITGHAHIHDDEEGG